MPKEVLGTARSVWQAMEKVPATIVDGCDDEIIDVYLVRKWEGSMTNDDDSGRVDDDDWDRLPRESRFSAAWFDARWGAAPKLDTDATTHIDDDDCKEPPKDCKEPPKKRLRRKDLCEPLRFFKRYWGSQSHDGS